MNRIKALLQNRAILEVRGSDRASFLQGLITNDIYKVSPTCTIYAALLTPQGRFLYDFFISSRNDAYFLETERARIDAIVTKLSLYKLRAQVTLTPHLTIPVYALWEAEGAMLWGGDKSEGIMQQNAFIDPRLPFLGLRGWGETFFPEISTVTSEDYVLHRLRLGIPEGGEDLVPEKAIPLEYGLDKLHAISWDKGCYMGQELTARTRYRGLIRKSLVPVTLEGPPPACGAPIVKNDKPVGEMRTHMKNHGLAVLRLEALDTPGTFMCGETRLTPSHPLWDTH